MGTVFVAGSVIDSINVLNIVGLPIVTATGDELKLQSDGQLGGVSYHPLTVDFGGSSFIYDSNEQLIGGTIEGFQWITSAPIPGTSIVGNAFVQIDGLNIPVSTALNWLATGDTTAALNTIFGGDDVVTGSPLADLMRGFGGNDTLSGHEGYDTIYGGAGDDVIFGGFGSGDTDPTEQNYLRGDDGNDTITGAAGFDDINGNQGNDLLHGGPGDDWVVGGKGNDVQFGDAGNDIVWGNLGNDTLDGGDGNDQVRGGQGDDVLYGGPGDDYLSGDRGNDTITGGPGADIFHSFSGAGIDKVMDFNLAEGDRVMLDPGTAYTVKQVGADTVIDMGNGDQMILVGVQMSTLTGNWIFEG